MALWKWSLMCLCVLRSDDEQWISQVGAGLPVVGPVQSLVRAGDEVETASDPETKPPSDASIASPFRADGQYLGQCWCLFQTGWGHLQRNIVLHLQHLEVGSPQKSWSQWLWKLLRESSSISLYNLIHILNLSIDIHGEIHGILFGIMVSLLWMFFFVFWCRPCRPRLGPGPAWSSQRLSKKPRRKVSLSSCLRPVGPGHAKNAQKAARLVVCCPQDK